MTQYFWKDKFKYFAVKERLVSSLMIGVFKCD